MRQVLLLGVAPETAQLLRERTGLDLLEDTADTAPALERIEGACHEVDAIVVGTAAPEPVRIAQRAQSLDRDLAVAILSDVDHHARVAAAIQWAPFVSSAVRCVATEPRDDLPRTIDELAAQTRQRRTHRRVVDRALEQATAAANDASDRVTHLQHLLEHLPIAILAVDEAGHVLASNRAAQHLLGCSERDLLGRDLGAGLPEGERGPLLAMIAAAVGGTAATAPASLTLIDPHGAVRVCEAIASPVPQRGGRRLATLTLQDVTEQRRMLAELRTADRLASVGLLAAGVAHEVNNPLTAVLINVERVLRVPGLEPRFQAPLRDALDASDRIRRIVRDLTLLARGDDDALGPVDVESVLRSTLRLATSQIRYRARTVEDFGDVPAARGNASRLGQVFLNVVINAMQAMPEERADRNELRIVTRADSAQVHVEIGDNGPGIAPDVMERLFTPFFTTKPPGEGTGLGLAICRRLVTGMGGTISVASELGAGTRVRIALPRAAEAVAASVPTSRTPMAAPGRRRRVLVIDDDALVARAARAMLSSRFDVEITTSPTDGLALAASGGFDAILCDLMMPELSGMAVHDAVLAAAPDAAARMIFMTGGAFTPAAIAFLDRIPGRWVGKPFEAASLIALIEALAPL